MGAGGSRSINVYRGRLDLDDQAFTASLLGTARGDLLLIMDGADTAAAYQTFFARFTDGDTINVTGYVRQPLGGAQLVLYVTG